ncbi:MAG: type I restriction enzyme HsdR N-terminal domain-containing protein [Muribaculaceae bacterium]|nr:type I restriction enzyme HsdR N-terminal domain-containing protein [Muribaculaceae bacterium]
MRVYDRLRQKFVALTPEEWVRLHFVAHLIDGLGFPEGLLANEVAISLNGTSRRCDTVYYAKEGLRPVAIMEYKAPHVKITQRVFDQISRYNMVLQVPWLFVSNGLEHYCCRVDYAAGRCVFLKDLPRCEDVTLL